MAYNEQSVSLKQVQKFGPELERAVVAALNRPKDKRRVIYYQHGELRLKYDLQVDAFYPDAAAPTSSAALPPMTKT
ncbi:MAG TPA: hypothetical protein VF588_16920 [Pyrinomonadaceae bacterium]|jgi:hypothetical protein